MSTPTWLNTLECSATSAFFVLVFLSSVVIAGAHAAQRPLPERNKGHGKRNTTGGCHADTSRATRGGTNYVTWADRASCVAKLKTARAHRPEHIVPNIHQGKRNMNVRDVYRLSLVAALAVGAAVWSVNRAPAAQDRADAEEGVEVLTRGPVHEAFAAIVTFDPEPGLVAPRIPPALIEELPPALKPEGNNVEWVPGYWAWDDERDDFLWISGVWRALPPGHEWVPGYWSPSGPGAQWTPG